MAGQGREINLGTLPLEQLNQLNDKVYLVTAEPEPAPETTEPPFSKLKPINCKNPAAAVPAASATVASGPA